MKGAESIPMDKVKDVLVTRVAIKLLKPEHIVDRVINFQFKDAVMHTKVDNEVEISGFGKFYASPAKMKKRLIAFTKSLEKVSKELENPEKLTLERKDYLESRREDTRRGILFLQTKLNESRLEGTDGGSEE